MLDSGVIDVAIGIVLLYLLISAMCSMFTEAVARFLNLRSKFLVVGIQRMMNGSSLADDLLKHPLVTGLKEPAPKSWPARAFTWLSIRLGGATGQGFPSYLPSNAFRASLVDKVIGKAGDGQEFLAKTKVTAEETFAALEKGVESVPDEDLKVTLRSLLREAEGDMSRAQAALESWFDQSMARVGGWYKRQVGWFLIAAAIVIVTALNADTVRIGMTLWQDQAVRSQVVALAGNATSEEFPPDTTELRNGLTDLKLLGWRSSDSTVSDPREAPHALKGWLYKLGGLLITVVAVQQGANFWFDLLKKLVNVRSSGPAPSTTAPAGSGGSAAGAT